jgi:hypothetical protein
VDGQQHVSDTLPLKNDPLLPTEYEAQYTPELVWMLWRREKSLDLARRQTTIPYSFGPHPTHYTNYATLTLTGM